MTRSPIVAGTFYDASPAACRSAVSQMLEQTRLPEDTPLDCVGGLVPHAGWICSGAVAALTFEAIARGWTGGTLVLLGAVHARSGSRGMVYPSGSWDTPLGRVTVDAELAERLLGAGDDLVADMAAHSSEHSLEVQLPFIQELWPGARIVPIMVPPTPLGVGIGQTIGRVLGELDHRVPVVGSTDLTHYGPRYGITPAGVGRAGLEWAQRNDRKLLQLIEQMAPEQILQDTNRTHSACGGGAIAAAIAACQVLGATRATILAHTNSSQTLRPYGLIDNDNVVGYASVVFS